MSEVDTLEPGPELDALVAEKVMGWHEWTNFDTGDYEGEFPMFLRDEGSEIGGVAAYRGESSDEPDDYGWSPSTSIADAWEVVEKLLPKIITIGNCKGGWCVFVWENDDVLDWEVEIDAPTAPHAICLAALKAVGVIE